MQLASLEQHRLVYYLSISITLLLTLIEAFTTTKERRTERERAASISLLTFHIDNFIVSLIEAFKKRKRKRQREKKRKRKNSVRSEAIV